MGINPMYVGTGSEDRFYVAFEMKALVKVCDSVKEFPPRHYIYSKDGDYSFKQYYTRDCLEYDNVKNDTTDVKVQKDGLMDAVCRQLMWDVPYGVLLSGGLDSSVISAIAKFYSEKRVEDDGKLKAWFPHLHSFAIGLEGAPDLKKA